MTPIYDHLDLSQHKRNTALDNINKTTILMAIFAITFILARGY